MWDEPRNQHLFMSSNLNAAQHLLDLLVTYDLTMLLPTGIPMLEANVSGNHTRPDNVFGSHLADMIISCNVAPEIRPTETDHYPIVTTLLLDPARMHPPPKRNYRMTNWEKFTKHLENQLVQLETQPSETEIPSAHTLENRLSGLTKAIENIIAKHVPLLQMLVDSGTRQGEHQSKKATKWSFRQMPATYPPHPRRTQKGTQLPLRKHPQSEGRPLV